MESDDPTDEGEATEDDEPSTEVHVSVAMAEAMERIMARIEESATTGATK